ncbi:MAG: type II toxin-antitoxin system VapC family toxin [Rhizobiaceae bacterium]
MILVDTSIWIDHIREQDVKLVYLLEKNLVAGHPIVTGEIAVGSMRNRATIIQALANLPCSVIAQNQEVMDFIELHDLYGTGIGFSDAHLLASVMLTPNAKIWTRDKRLAFQAAKLEVALSDH